jgi:DNA-directed RNA polymerase specialized sigma24 family protein
MIVQRPAELSDEQLMARLGGPELEAALSTLYDRYNRTVYAVGLKILGERTLAEELVQDVFLKVWRSSHLRSFARQLLNLALQGHALRRHRSPSKACQQGSSDT